MTCDTCDKMQEKNRKGKMIPYLRIGNSNVSIGACDKHFNELRMKMGMDVNPNSMVHRVK